MNPSHRKLTLLLLVSMHFSATAVLKAEEGGGGHYNPGATASAIDAVPSRPGLAVFSFSTFYAGSADGGVPIKFGSNAALGVKADVFAQTIGAVYAPDFKLFGGSYATAVALPYIWMDVKANAELTGPKGNTLVAGNFKDSTDGIGDVSFYPLMLGWTALGGDLKYDIRQCIYAPTGEYSEDALANPGKNYWTFEPGASISYMSSKTGTEASLFMGIDFNTKNEATDYQTGTQLHFDGTLEQHLPILGGLAGVGVTGYYYQQIEGDSGSGATLGGFEGRTIGVGPVVSYMRKIGNYDAFAEVKWLPEIEVKNRTEGDYIWVKMGILF